MPGRFHDIKLADDTRPVRPQYHLVASLHDHLLRDSCISKIAGEREPRPLLTALAGFT